MNDWDNGDEKNEFMKMLQKLGMSTFGLKAFKNQCKAMEKGLIKIPENNLRNGTYPLIQINRMIPFLGTSARKYSIEDLNKIIVNSLTPKAMYKYMGEGGDDLDDQTDILDLILMINTELQFNKETKALEQQQQSKKSNQNQQSNKKGESKGEQKKNPCRKHGGAHDYKDCPDHKNKSGKLTSESGKENSIKKDLHSTKSDSTTSKKTPMVMIGKKQNENHYADLDYLSDNNDGSAMMGRK